MRLFDLFRRCLSMSSREKWLYKRGMVRAKLGQTERAIEDYTTVIEARGGESKLRAMAAYNRALVYYANGEIARAMDDLHEILKMPGAPNEVKTESRRKLARIERSTERGG